MQNLQVFCRIKFNRSPIIPRYLSVPAQVSCGDVLVIQFRHCYLTTRSLILHPTLTTQAYPSLLVPFIPFFSVSVVRHVSMDFWHQHHRRLEPSKGRPLRLRSLAARCSGGPREAVRVLGAGGESWSSIKLSGLPSASPSGRLPQLEPGDIVSSRSSLANPTTVS